MECFKHSSYFLYIKNAREKRFETRRAGKSYQEIISKLTDKLNIVEDVKKDVEEIKNHVFKENK